MNQRIIYKTNDGGIAVITPMVDCGLTVEQIALKDVPAGKPFKIVDAADIPIDRSQRDAWTVDDADLTDGVGVGARAFFIQQLTAELAQTKAMTPPEISDDELDQWQQGQQQHIDRLTAQVHSLESQP